MTQPTTTLVRLQKEAAAGLLNVNEAGKARVRVVLEDGSDYITPAPWSFRGDGGPGHRIQSRSVPRNWCRIPTVYSCRACSCANRSMKASVEGVVLAPQQGVSHNQKGEPTTGLGGSETNTVEAADHQDRSAIGDRGWYLRASSPGTASSSRGSNRRSLASRWCPKSTGRRMRRLRSRNPRPLRTPRSNRRPWSTSSSTVRSLPGYPSPSSSSC